jgi:hypothetical protein
MCMVQGRQLVSHFSRHCYRNSTSVKSRTYLLAQQEQQDQSQLEQQPHEPQQRPDNSSTNGCSASGSESSEQLGSFRRSSLTTTSSDFSFDTSDPFSSPLAPASLPTSVAAPEADAPSLASTGSRSPSHVLVSDSNGNGNASANGNANITSESGIDPFHVNDGVFASYTDYFPTSNPDPDPDPGSVNDESESTVGSTHLGLGSSPLASSYIPIPSWRLRRRQELKRIEQADRRRILETLITEGPATGTMGTCEVRRPCHVHVGGGGGGGSSSAGR